MRLMQAFTIGHADRRIDSIVSELSFQGITHVLDIRPTEGRTVNCPEISSQLLIAGIRYADMGRMFGYETPISAPESEAVAKSPKHMANMQIVFEIGDDPTRKLCLLGGPPESHRCHRSYLLGESLATSGFDVLHIENGFPIPHTLVMERVLIKS